MVTIFSTIIQFLNSSTKATHFLLVVINFIIQEYNISSDDRYQKGHGNQ